MLIIRNKLIYLNCCLFMLFECISIDAKIIAIYYDMSLLCSVNVKIFQSWLFNNILYCLIGLIIALCFDKIVHDTIYVLNKKLF